MNYRRATRIARGLESAVLALGFAALLYRATLYGLIERPPGAAWGRGDVIDFGLGVVLFLLGGVCAGAGILLSTHPDCSDRGVAYRPVLIGMTTFVVYYLLHPYIPVLNPE